MLQDVGIAERQKVQKQGRDDHIKQLSIQTPYISIFDILVLWKKIPVGGLYRESCLCHPSRERLTRCLKGCLGQ